MQTQETGARGRPVICLDCGDVALYHASHLCKPCRNDREATGRPVRDWRIEMQVRQIAQEGTVTR